MRVDALYIRIHQPLSWVNVVYVVDVVCVVYVNNENYEDYENNVKVVIQLEL